MKAATDFVRRVNAAIAKKKIAAKAMLGGSLAKGTYLKGDYDVDVFVIFAQKYKNKDISKLLKTVLPKTAEVVHGSRDYYHVRSKGIQFEIVPVLAINKASEAVNVTDVSPLHVAWVKKNIGKKADQVRMAKRFCKAQNVYGAESYINGFSGYILEILTLHYGGFKQLLKAASSWKYGEVIDTQRHYRSGKEAVKKLNDAKLNSPIVVIDPVQKERNAAAAVSNETCTRFMLAAKRYLMKPSTSFFRKQEFDLKAIRAEAKQFGLDLLLLEVIPLSGKEDVVGSKIVKVYTYLKRQLELHDFTVVAHDWHWNDSVMLWYMVYPQDLPKVKLHPGPIIYAADAHIKQFLKKHKHVVVEEKRLLALVKRQWTEPRKAVQSLLKETYVKEKVSKISLRR